MTSQSNLFIFSKREGSMGVIEDFWRKDMCRVEDGIFFPDDTYIGLERVKSGGFRPVGNREPVAPLLERDDDGWEDRGWTHLNNAQPIYTGEVKVWGGGADSEEEAFLAVCDAAGNLHWLLHHQSCEPFTEARLEGKDIIAVSKDVSRYDWRIPIDSPADFHVIEGFNG